MLGRSSWKLILICSLIAGCTSMCGVQHSDMTAEQVVEAYLTKALNMNAVSERDDLLKLTTGELNEALAKASDETIRAAYVDVQYTLVEYGIVERRDRTPRETEITFKIGYQKAGEGISQQDAEALVETENKLGLIRLQGKWYIREVLGAKTTIDFPVSEASQITASP